MWALTGMKPLSAIAGHVVVTVLFAGVVFAQPPDAASPDAAPLPESEPPQDPATPETPPDPASAPEVVPLQTPPLVVGDDQSTGDQEEKKKKKKKKRKKGERKAVNVSGYVQFSYKHRFDTNNDGMKDPGAFRVTRARVKLSGDIKRWASYVVEIDPRSPTIYGFMRDAYIELRLIPMHRLLLGQQKTRFGYENGVSSSEAYTVTRSELGEGPARGITLRDIGVGVIGKVPLGQGFSLEDAVTLVNGSGMNVQVDETPRKNLWGRVGGRYRDKDRKLDIRLGVSAAFGNQLEPEDPGPPVTPAFTFTFRRFGVDVEIDTPWAFLAAELGTSTEESPAFTEPEESMGYYVMLVGKTPWNVGPVFRYDAFDAEEFKRFTFGGYWGAPKKKLRALTHYEVFEDSAGAHDHRVTAMLIAKFE